MFPFFWLIDTAIGFYKWVVIAAVVVSLLVNFGVLDTRNRLVWQIGEFLERATEPALRPIRNVLPNFGAIDISPLVLIVLLHFAQLLLWQTFDALR
ncbi:MAG: YggT family protein [Acetobacteraceae bacterium]|nr:YggT family protein [Acetobacteraceae bacterium]